MSVWSPFAKAVTEIVPLQENHSITIQKLGWKALADAALETQRKGIALAREIGPGGLLKELSSRGGEEEVKKQVEAEPYLSFDRQILLERGIKAWTFSEPVSPSAIGDLDDDIAKMLAKKVYELSRPPEEQKNV